VCLPGAIEYQHLHADTKDSFELSAGRLGHAERIGITLKRDAHTGELDLPTQRLIVERTAPHVTINFVLAELTWENGPIRQIAGSHGMQGSPPLPEEEPEWMRLSTLVGAPAGSAVFRDTRAWHGGTPNLSRDVRSMPNIEYVAPWMDGFPFMQSMPYEKWLRLTPHAQRICRRIRAEPGVWPPGAGVMHPLASARKRAATPT
jgi:hypothetical protein